MSVHLTPQELKVQSVLPGVQHSTGTCPFLIGCLQLCLHFSLGEAPPIQVHTNHQSLVATECPLDLLWS